MTILRNRFVTVQVKAIRQETPLIRSYELVDPDDWELPPFTPGAHVDIQLDDELVRSYSLCSDPMDRHRYRIGVLQQSGGRGGSTAMHDRVREGDILSLSLPKNHFPLAAAAGYSIFIGGGIGITPLLSMIEALERDNASFVFHVCTRSLAETPFRARLAPLITAGKAVLHHDGGEPRRGLDLNALLAIPQPNSHVYCCGPQGFMRAVREATSSWSPGTVHFENFDSAATLRQGPQNAYQVTLARSRVTLAVSAHETMAAALRRHGIAIDTACEAGTCRTCAVRYLGGKPIHRDFVLTPEERRDTLTPCVSGCASDLLVLDL